MKTKEKMIEVCGGIQPEEILAEKSVTELVFIIDRSGSMSGLESDTIGGFNSMIEKQKKEVGDCYVSTVLFDNEPKVVAQVKDADVVVFAGGISPRLEGEEMGVNLPGFKGGDRTDIELPAIQRNLLKALAAAGKKVVLVNCSGSPIGLVPETKSCQAIVQAWYLGQAGGQAVADVLFGNYNPSGKLPVTFYKNVAITRPIS